MFALLPPFHAFGFSIAGLFPLLCGVKVFFSPDPTKTSQMIFEIQQWKPTLICAPPTFLQAIVDRSHPHQLASLKLVVSGAEKAPSSLFNSFLSLNKDIQVLEGYGITECSPVVTLNRPGFPRKGVGPPLPGVDLMIVDPQSHLPVPEEGIGEICIAGPSVFSGYLDLKKDPFFVLNGKKWYRSGDLGQLKEKSLFLLGRIKRFVKIGGEMVSIGGIEEHLDHLCRTSSSTSPSLALVSKEVEGQKPQLILFTTSPLELEQVNQFLKEAGWSSLARVARIKKVDQIPLTAMGKIHYAKLEEQV